MSKRIFDFTDLDAEIAVGDELTAKLWDDFAKHGISCFRVIMSDPGHMFRIERINPKNICIKQSGNKR